MAQLSPSPAPEADLVSQADVFVALADELERARAMGLRVEGAICAIAVRAAIDSAVVAELQQLDAVLQHIAALRDFAGELGRQSGAGGKISLATALERITLADVRARLSGQNDTNPDEHWEMF